MLIVDTGVLLAAADSADPDHDSCASLIGTEPGPLIGSPLVIAEATYLIGRQLGARAEAALVRAVAADEIVMEQLTKSDLGRVATPVDQYEDLSLGATDASVIVLAERHGQDAIATLDRRHFSVVRSAAGSAFELVP